MKKLYVTALVVLTMAPVVIAQIKVYNNYDFVPGALVLFDDNFKDDQKGEFPGKWELESGQAVVDRINGEAALLITDGDPSVLVPRLKTTSYLTDPFTVEFDYYTQPGKKNGVHVFLIGADHKRVQIYFGETGKVSSSGFAHDFDAPFPDRDAKFEGLWHHAEMIYKNGQVKTYLDKVRVANMATNAAVTPISIKIGGQAWINNPIIVRNFRIASGGTMNVTGMYKPEKNAGRGNASNTSMAITTSTNIPSPNSSLKVYNNYDFVPGETVLFEDNFMDDQDGEFPAKWDLLSGQGVLNQLNGAPAFFITNGDPSQVAPKLATDSYLTDPFTFEFDYYVQNDKRHGVNVFLACADHKRAQIFFGESGNVSSYGLTHDFNVPFPDRSIPFNGQWHHAAMIYKNDQLKTYVDQYRIAVAPNTGLTPVSLRIGSEASIDNPIIIKNVRLASGGSMNMIDKKFTDSKIVTHGINFDYGKSTIRPESMGTLNMIRDVMTDNPDLKFEVGGHTDNDGDAAYNLKLSQDRAEAVRLAMIDLGIAAARLTSKGYGLTKPISDNNTQEGKANNRRVEFVKF